MLAWEIYLEFIYKFKPHCQNDINVLKDNKYMVYYYIRFNTCNSSIFIKKKTIFNSCYKLFKNLMEDECNFTSIKSVINSNVKTISLKNVCIERGWFLIDRRPQIMW